MTFAGKIIISNYVLLVVGNAFLLLTDKPPGLAFNVYYSR